MIEQSVAPLLRVEGIRKSFGTREILKGIDLAVNKGEVVCIIGPSGSGKSTFIRCINFLEQPTGGKIFFRGEDVWSTYRDLSLYRTKVGMVFQSFNLFNNMTVLENCMVGQVKVLKKDTEPAKETAIKYLKHVGMDQYLKAKPKQLSGGQKQRVAIARALALEPEILLMDEPTSALDSEMVGEVLSIMKQLADEGMTMLVVTHEMAFARDAADKVVFIDQGVVAELNPPSIIFKNPENPRTAEFLSRFNKDA